MPTSCFWDLESSLQPLFWICFHVCCLFPLHLFGLLGFYPAPSSVTYFLLISIFFLSFFFFFWWVGVIALQVVLAWGVQLRGLKAVGKSQVFVSRWEPPEDLTPSNIPWSLRLSVSLAIWTQSSHHRSSGLTPGLGTKIPQVYSKKRKKCERCRTITKLKIKIEKLKMHVRK